MLKTVISILIVVLLAGAGFYGYTHFFVKGQENDQTGNTSTSQTYTNEALGLSFTYKPNFSVTENTTDDVVHIALIEKDYVPPKNGEGPPTITIDVIPSDVSKLEMSEWVPDLAAHGFSSITASALFATTTVAHREAFLFRTDGLYAGYATVVRAGARLYIFSVQYVSIEDAILDTYATLLGTVHIQ